jgi:hypothetical protein
MQAGKTTEKGKKHAPDAMRVSKHESRMKKYRRRMREG